MGKKSDEAWDRFQQAMRELRRIDTERLRWWRWFHGVFNNAIGAVIIIGEDGRVLEWNHVAERLFGWTPREAIGQKIDLLIIPAPKRAAHIAAVERFLETGASNVFDRERILTAVTRDGVEIPVSIRIFRMRVPNGRNFGYEFGAIISPVMIALKEVAP